MKASIRFGSWWLRFRYPDSGIWRLETRRWTYKDKPMARTDWFKIFP